MRLEKKDGIIIFLCLIIGISFLFTLLNINFINTPRNQYCDLCVNLVIGIDEGPRYLDPMGAWDEASFAVQDQVCEGLFGYNYTDPNMEIIPRLAKDYGNWEGANYTVKLRDDVWFHDGTRFDATTAKWNFDRLAYLMETHQAKSSELFQYYDPDFIINETTGEKGKIFPIINKTVVLDNYRLRFVCNIPYGAFEALLCFNAAYMLSPKSTPFNMVIDTATGDLVGTGPFVYDHYKPGVEVQFHVWDYYWRPRARIDDYMFFSIIEVDQIRNNALLSGDIDFLQNPMTSMLDYFEEEPDIDLIQKGTALTIEFLGMNNNWINSTFRRAISYAINYSYIIEELMGGHVERLKSPIPNGINFANDSFNVAKYNKTKARMIMQSMGYGSTFNLSNDNVWRSAQFVSYNYTYKIGNSLEENIYLLLVEDLGEIGINVIDAGCFQPWPDPCCFDIYCPLELRTRNQVQLFWGQWLFDYNDPDSYISPLFTNRSQASNRCVYDGYFAAKENGRNELALWDNVQLLLEEAIIETNQTLRRSYYNRIQQLLIEEDMPWAFGVVRKNYDAVGDFLSGVATNPADKTYIYPIYFDVTSLYIQ